MALGGDKTQQDSAEVKQLKEKVAQVTEERDRLREELDTLKRDGVQAQANVRPEPHKPSFGMSEGTRAELEQRDETTDPFTGDKVTRKDAPKGVEFNTDADKK